MMNNKPLKTFSYGCIKIGVWPQNSDLGPAYTVTPRRIFKKDDLWCNATSFGDYDLASLIIGLLETHLWIQNQKPDKDSSIRLPLLVESQNMTEESDKSETGGLKPVRKVEPANSSTQTSQE